MPTAILTPQKIVRPPLSNETHSYPLIFSDLVIVPGPNAKQHVTPLRELTAHKLGSLVTVRCQVVRVSNVKPSLKVACYVCDVCGHEIY